MNTQNTAISVKNVYKSFKLPHEQHSGLKQAILNVFKKNKKHGYEMQHVLKNVSFDIKEGEFFGIVGRNGSGKSTLLKLISEIYTPDKGSIRVNGKLTPFIELGVGFNPELTGRENVFLNGALLGFSKKEIETMYEDIVEFAELEAFMDQKLKNYSSGMQVRLAFSVAIQAESDILVLDEVLAVGDEAFQRKCDEYFQAIKKDKTKTVILVTHSMDAVRKYCTRAIYIRDGNLIVNGTPEEVANQYTEDNYESKDEKKDKDGDHETGLSAQIPHLKVVPKSKRILSSEDEMRFDVEYEITSDIPVHTFISIIDERRGVSIVSNGAEAIGGRGKHRLTYIFPLGLYNDLDILVVAALDESGTKRRIAFTSDINSCRFAVRNSVSDNGLLRKDNSVHGHWIDQEEYMYNLKDS